MNSAYHILVFRLEVKWIFTAMGKASSISSLNLCHCIWY